MTNQDLELRLHAWYQTDIGEEPAPQQLRADLATLLRTAADSRRPLTAGWRFPSLNRFAPIALVATAVVVALLIGISFILRPQNVGPPQEPGPSHSATTESNPSSEPSARPATWSSTASMSEPRFGFSATRLADGRVLVAGGAFDASHNGQTAAELFDPATGTWAPTGSMLTGRYRHSATLLSDGRVLVAGGNAGDSATLGAACCLASAELYDPSTGTWAATGSMVEARVDFVATLLLDGRVLVAGGDNAHVNGTEPGAELYDPARGTWTATEPMVVSNYGNQAAQLANGQVLVVGGINYNTAPELYDPSRGSWSVLDCAVGIQFEGRCDKPSSWRTATVLPDGNVLLTSGNDAAIYDPAAETWSPTGRPVVTSPQSAVLLLNGTVLVLFSGDFRHPNVAEIYDPRTGTWAATARPKDVRSRAVATLLLDGRVLLLGGLVDTGLGGLFPVATAELYDPGVGS